jgi:hypothetical protein
MFREFWQTHVPSCANMSRQECNFVMPVAYWHDGQSIQTEDGVA